MELPIGQIKTGWDADLHVHNHWSLDIPNGPKPEDYLEAAEENKIHIGFLDHYELAYRDNPPLPKEKEWQPVWPFTGNNWNKYLEKMDELKSNYPFISSGLEIDYYYQREDELRNFVDDNKGNFDLLVGTLHDAAPCSPVTILDDLKRLVKTFGSFKAVADIYFDLEEKMIRSGIFDAVAHIDTIYRYCGSAFPMKEEYNTNEQTKKIAKLCIDSNTWFEINLSGFRYPVGRPFPTFEMAKKFLAQGAKMFVGSDSHTVESFTEFSPRVHNANQFIRENSL